MPYAIPNVRYENGPASAHVRIGWYRSVFNIPHALRGLLARGRNGGPGRARFSRVFARTHRAAKENRSQGQGVNYPNYGSRSSFIRSIPDGCAARLILPQRTRGQPLPSRRGRGIAVDRSFVTYVAAVVQVAISDDGHVSVPRIDIWPSIAAWR
jgi:isoquinoline 1-oxidoreductase subunit beta